MTADSPEKAVADSLAAPVSQGISPELFRRRAGVIAGGLALLTLVIAVRFLILGTGDTVTPQGHWREFIIPAMRGRILDTEGRPLAWSEREIALVYEKPELLRIAWQDMALLQDITNVPQEELMKKVRTSSEDSLTLFESIPPELVAAMDNLTTSPRFRMETRFKRYYGTQDARTRNILGVVRQFGRREIGISGIEKRLNQRLTGKDGRFRVMVDADERWVKGTWEALQKPQAGFDVCVGD